MMKHKLSKTNYFLMDVGDRKREVNFREIPVVYSLGDIHAS